MATDAIPEVPEFITSEMDARFAAEARRTVHKVPLQPGPTKTHGRRGPDPVTLDGLHTVLAGVTIALAAITIAVGLLFIWLAVPGLAYILLGVASLCGLGWLVYFPMARRSRASEPR